MLEISQEEARAIARQFQSHLDNNFYTRFSLEPSHYHKAREWISRFETPLRTLDALHLACASSSGLRLVTADDALAKSANTFGVEVQLLSA